MGDLCDGINGLWYLSEGDNLNAGLSFSAMIPFAGIAVIGAKWGIKAIKGAKYGERIVEATSKVVRGAKNTGGRIIQAIGRRTGRILADETGAIRLGWKSASKGAGEAGNTLDLTNALKYREYIRDIEAQTGRKIPMEQVRELKNALKNNQFEKLGDAEKAMHREAFNDIKDDLISQWENNTGQVWPRHGTLVRGKSGKVLRNPNSPYDAHEIIPNMYGGPLEWWNIHPARWPNEHQGGIHRAAGVWNELFK